MLNTTDDDDYNLEGLGYKSSFRREFSNLATISFAFSILVCFCLPIARSPALWPWSSQGLCSSVAMTFNTPLLLGGPTSVRVFLNCPGVLANDR